MDIRKPGFENRLEVLLEYMKGHRRTESEFDFLLDLGERKDLSEDELIHACFYSVSSGDWSLKAGREGEVTRYLLSECSPPSVLQSEEQARQLEEDLTKKYEADKFKRGNHRKYLYCYTHESWKFNEKDGGAIVSSVRSYVKFLDGKLPSKVFQQYRSHDDPFEEALEDLQSNIDTFGTLAAFDFLQALNQVAHYRFFHPHYVYALQRGDSGVPRGMKYLIMGNKKGKWKRLRECRGLSKRKLGEAIKEVEQEVIDAARERFPKWPEEKLVFDIESSICNFQKALEGEEEPSTALRKI